MNAKKLISLLLVLVMILSLAGCGSEKDKLIGKWVGEVDFTGEFNDMMMQGMDAEMGEYIVINSFKLTMVLTLDANGTYTLGLDEEALNKTVDDLKSDLKAGLEAYFEDLLAESGLTMSVDELLAMSGTNMDELLDSAISQEMIKEVMADAVSSGEFDAKNGKLYMTTDGETGYDNYELKGNTLTLTNDEASASSDDFMSSLYPMVFTRVS